MISLFKNNKCDFESLRSSMITPLKSIISNYEKGCQIFKDDVLEKELYDALYKLKNFEDLMNNHIQICSSYADEKKEKEHIILDKKIEELSNYFVDMLEVLKVIEERTR